MYIKAHINNNERGIKGLFYAILRHSWYNYILGLLDYLILLYFYFILRHSVQFDLCFSRQKYTYNYLIIRQKSAKIE